MALQHQPESSPFDREILLGISQAQVRDQALPPYDGASSPSSPKLHPVNSPAGDGDIPSMNLPPPAYPASSSSTSIPSPSHDFLLTPRSSDQSFLTCATQLQLECVSEAQPGPVTDGRARSFSWSVASRDRCSSMDGSTILDADELAIYENRTNVLREQAAQRARRAETQAAFAYDQVTLADSDIMAHGWSRQRRQHGRYPQVYTYEDFRRYYAPPPSPSAARRGASVLPPPISARVVPKEPLNWGKIAMSIGALCVLIGVIAGLSVVARVTSNKPDPHH